MGVTEASFCSFVPVFLEQLVYDKGINFQRPSNGRCPASGRSGRHEADDHQSAITEQATQGELALLTFTRKNTKNKGEVVKRDNCK